jgi:tetratricopeptide (TPR) repeat protein
MFKEGLAHTSMKLGNSYLTIGKLDQALEFYQILNRSYIDLNKEEIKSLEYKDYLAISNAKLGDVFRLREDYKTALPYYETYNQLEKELNEAFPANINFKQNLAISYQYLGLVHRKLGNNDRLLGISEKMKVLFQELNATSPQNVFFKNGLLASYQEIGDAYIAQKQYQQAIEPYEKFQTLLKELQQANPQNIAYANGVAISYDKLGDLYRLEKNYPKAKENFLIAGKNYFNLSLKYPQYAEFQQNAANLEQRLTEILSFTKDYAGQYHWALEKLNILQNNQTEKAKLAEAYNQVAGWALFDKKFAEAEKYALLGLETDPSLKWINANLALACLFQGKYKKAQEIYNRLKDKVFNQNFSYKEVFLKDLNELESAGITHKDIKKARELLTKK